MSEGSKGVQRVQTGTRIRLVRGQVIFFYNWHIEDDLNYLANGKCKKISIFEDLNFFKNGRWLNFSKLEYDLPQGRAPLFGWNHNIYF